MTSTEKIEQFISLMKSSDEAEADGFTLLAKRGDADEFFDRLRRAGLLDATRAKGPAPTGRPNEVTIPYWKGLDYLNSVARIATEANHAALQKSIVDVVLSFSKAADINP